MKKLERFLEPFQFVKGFDWVGRHRFFSAMFSGLSNRCPLRLALHAFVSDSDLLLSAIQQM
jgi:hypothetical protein